MFIGYPFVYPSDIPFDVGQHGVNPGEQFGRLFARLAPTKIGIIQSGQLQEVIKRDSSGNQNIYNQHGQLQKVLKRNSSGTQNVYNEHGQLQETIKPDGTIMNQHGQR